MSFKYPIIFLVIILFGLLLSAAAVQAAGNAPYLPQNTPEPADSLLEGTLREDLHGILDAGALNLIPGVAGSGLDLNAATLWTQDVLSDSAQSGDEFSSVIVSGDFNGDGLFDVAIGIPHEDWESWDGLDTRIDSGAVNVIYNTPHGLDAANHQFWDQNKTGVSAVEANDEFGSALAAGDFNGDGFDDLAISAPHESLEREGKVITATGVVVVLFGTPTGLSSNHAVLLTEDACDLTETAHDFFGYAMTSGDFNNDHVDDLVVGIPGNTVNTQDDAGRICVFYNDSTGFHPHSSRSTWFRQGSAEAGDYFGNVLTSGDFNGDGYDDVVIGDPYEDVFTKTDAGAIFLLYGASDGLDYSTAQEWWQDIIKDESGHPRDPSENNDKFGFALASGDFNGDGKDDLLIGTPNEADSLFGSDFGVVQMMQGGAHGLTIINNAIWDDVLGDLFGYSLTTGDFNDDGHTDFAVGIPGYAVHTLQYAGAVKVFYNSGNPSNMFPVSSTRLITDDDLPHNTSEAYDRFGNTLAVLPKPRKRIYLPLVNH